MYQVIRLNTNRDSVESEKTLLDAQCLGRCLKDATQDVVFIVGPDDAVHRLPSDVRRRILSRPRRKSRPRRRTDLR